MRIGTKSVLFGAHQFLLHPCFVAAAWWKLYGFPWDPRLWVAFWVHDLGYLGKPNMDGEEGELHPYWGAFLMGVLFGRKWYEFTLYHSRFLARRNAAHHSRLCVADKYAICLTPGWLYLPMVRFTGEVQEYMKMAELRQEIPLADSQEQWWADVQEHMGRWVAAHVGGGPDTMTPPMRQKKTSTGVWE